MDARISSHSARRSVEAAYDGVRPPLCPDNATHACKSCSQTSVVDARVDEGHIFVPFLRE